MPVVFDDRDETPIELLLAPVVLAESAALPKTELLLPVVLRSIAWLPIAVLEKPVVAAFNAENPPAALSAPVSVRLPEFAPRKVFCVPKAWRNGLAPRNTEPALGRARLPVNVNC